MHAIARKGGVILRMGNTCCKSSEPEPRPATPRPNHTTKPYEPTLESHSSPYDFTADEPPGSTSASGGSKSYGAVGVSKSYGEVGSSVVALIEESEDSNDFSYDGVVTTAKVVRVKDGDTCVIKFEYNGERVQKVVRMLGYNSRELKPRKNVPNRDAVIRQAWQDTEIFIRLLGPDMLVEAHLGKFDNFGRILATFYVDGVSVNQQMLDLGGGVPYRG